MIILDAPYVTLEEADVYFDQRMNSEDWEHAIDKERISALVEATRIIKTLIFSSFPITDLAFLNALKIATCEIAINLLDGTDMEQEIDNLFVVSQTYATIKTGYNPSVVPEHLRAGVPSAVAWNILKPYLRDPHKLTLRRGR